MIEYLERYSTTDELDKLGRWARIAVFKQITIAWISKHKDENGDYIFMVNNRFPTMCNNQANETRICKSLEASKDFVNERWEWFKEQVK